MKRLSFAVLSGFFCAIAMADCPPPPPPTGTCSPYSGPKGTLRSPDGKSYQTINTPVVALKTAVVTSGGWLRPSVVQNTSTPPGLKVQLAFSECPGNFDVPAACTRTGNASGFYLGAGSGQPCPLTVGKKYYFNVKTLDCTSNSCPFYLNYYGNF